MKKKVYVKPTQIDPPAEFYHREDCPAHYGPNKCICRRLDYEDENARAEDRADAKRKYGE